MINEMGEAQLISLIKEKNWPAISFWLRHRNPKFKERIEINASIQSPQDELTPEQQTVVKEALRLASLTVDTGIKEINQNINQNDNDQQHSTVKPGGADVQRT